MRYNYEYLSGDIVGLIEDIVSESFTGMEVMQSIFTSGNIFTIESSYERLGYLTSSEKMNCCQCSSMRGLNEFMNRGTFKIGDVVSLKEEIFHAGCKVSFLDDYYLDDIVDKMKEHSNIFHISDYVAESTFCIILEEFPHHLAFRECEVNPLFILER